jgi:hypothetical protein
MAGSWEQGTKDRSREYSWETGMGWRDGWTEKRGRVPFYTRILQRPYKEGGTPTNLVESEQLCLYETYLAVNTVDLYYIGSRLPHERTNCRPAQCASSFEIPISLGRISDGRAIDERIDLISFRSSTQVFGVCRLTAAP